MIEKDCPSFPGYSVTENGAVYNHRRRIGLGGGIGGTRVVIDPNHKQRLREFIHSGYRCVNMSKINTRCSGPVCIHAILMDAFIGPLPKKAETRHLDGNRLNNSLSNLKYGTHAENAEDRRIHGRDPVGELNPRAKLTARDVVAIRASYSTKARTQTGLAKNYGVSQATISRVVLKQNWARVISDSDVRRGRKGK